MNVIIGFVVFIGLVVTLISTVGLIATTIKKSRKMKWLISLCIGILVLVMSFFLSAAYQKDIDRAEEASESRAEESAIEDDPVETNDSDDESTSESENTSSNSNSTESKASVSSKTDNVSESLSAFKQSVQKRVENQSSELSKVNVDSKTNGVTYTATASVTRYDQFKLQKLASDLFSGTQGIARMCDIPTPVPVTLNSANGNILARYKLNGDIKVYPQN